MKVDDWVQIKDTGEVGVVVAIGELVVVRVPQENNPFPKNVATGRSNLKRYYPQANVKQEKALL